MGPRHALWLAVGRANGIDLDVHAATGELVVSTADRSWLPRGGVVQRLHCSERLALSDVAGHVPAASAAHRLRLGVFGGSFDPPHNAHVALASAGLAQLALDALHVVPTGVAWHKKREPSAPQDRLAMTRLAFADMPKVVIDDRELQRAGPTFTIDTLQALQQENPTAQLYLIMGADQFAAFRQWHRWQAILEIAILCVAERAINTWTSGMFDSFADQKSRFCRLEMPESSISATQVRLTAASALSVANNISSLVSPLVARYIATHQLYKAD